MKVAHFIHTHDSEDINVALTAAFETFNALRREDNTIAFEDISITGHTCHGCNVGYNVVLVYSRTEKDPKAVQWIGATATAEDEDIPVPRRFIGT